MSSAAHHVSEAEGILARTATMDVDDPATTTSIAAAQVHADLAQAYALNDLFVGLRRALEGKS